jgi:hypothetical protein
VKYVTEVSSRLPAVRAKVDLRTQNAARRRRFPAIIRMFDEAAAIYGKIAAGGDPLPLTFVLYFVCCSSGQTKTLAAGF